MAQPIVEIVQLTKSYYRDKTEIPVLRELSLDVNEGEFFGLIGPSGSGKTTQLPKLCLELGRGVQGLIGHTQPRRIAAQAVAARGGVTLTDPVAAQAGDLAFFLPSGQAHPSALLGRGLGRRRQRRHRSEHQQVHAAVDAGERLRGDAREHLPGVPARVRRLDR